MSNGRKRVFRAVAAATSVAFEWIFLAFPLAAVVTRLRLKYLLVDFATMGNRLPLFLFSFSLQRARAFEGHEKFTIRKKKKVLRDFFSLSLSLCLLVLFISTNFHANFRLCFPPLPFVPFNLLLFSGKGANVGKNSNL